MDARSGPYGSPRGPQSLTAARPTRVLDPRKALARQLPALAIVVVLAVLLRHKIADLDVDHIRRALATVEPLQWVMGLGLTAISFWSLGQYDVVVHRLVGRDTDPRRAARSGMAAIALGQTLGMGAVTGSFVRWRLLPGLGLIDATKISAIVSLSFFAAWAVVVAVSILLIGAAVPFAGLLSGLVLLAAFGCVMLSLVRPGPTARLPFPPVKAMGLILAFTTIDTFAAAGALWAMMPAEVTLPFGTVAVAYLLALGAGLILSTPGGVGPFEMALIALLPAAGEEPLLATVLAFRVVYYAVPAVLAACVALRPANAPTQQSPARAAVQPVNPDHLPLMVEAALASAPRAEAALLRHGRFDLLSNARGWPTALVARSGQSLIMLGDPLSCDRAGDEVFGGLTDRAKVALRAPVLYKCGARLAAQARRTGWRVLPIAREAYLDPRTFTEAGSARRQLRRKLRKAEAVGLTIKVISPNGTGPLPLPEMDAVAEDWANRRGGERGFSMGVWNPTSLRQAMVVLARDCEGGLVGFLTLHVNRNEATLDLMRQGDTAPDGLMHLLVTRAIEAAADMGLPRFSLAAVPYGKRGTKATTPRNAWLRAALDKATGADGLRQFKTTFAPKWETLYMAAPTRAALVLGAIDVTREIMRDARRRDV